MKHGALTIAVTGLNATDNPGPGVPVLRSLADANSGHRFIGLLYDTLEPGVYIEDLTARNYLIPYPSNGLETMFERISYIHEREKIDFLLPTLDTELYVFSKLAPRLSELGIGTFLPSTNQLNLRGKDRLSRFCEEHDIPAPKTEVLNSLSELEKAVKDFSFPVFIKGAFYDAAPATNLAEAVAVFQRLQYKWGLPVLIQERMQGDEFNVAGLGDGKGNALAAVAMRKLYITDKGKGWAGVTIYDDELLKTARRVISVLNWTGGLELEFVKAKSNGEYYLLEINPRFPAWIYLATAAGQNMPEALVRFSTGVPVKPLVDYEVGKVFVRASWDLITDMSRIERLTTAGEI